MEKEILSGKRCRRHTKVSVGERSEWRKMQEVEFSLINALPQLSLAPENKLQRHQSDRERDVKNDSKVKKKAVMRLDGVELLSHFSFFFMSATCRQLLLQCWSSTFSIVQTDQTTLRGNNMKKKNESYICLFVPKNNTLYY